MPSSRRKIYSILLVGFLAALIVRTFFFEAFIVRGDSMSPTVVDGDYVFVNKLAYAFGRTPAREDIIVAYPRELKQKILKRVIGLPGELFAVEQGHVTLRSERGETGTVLAEAYLDGLSTPMVGRTRIYLDPEEYFALGDNRTVSIDSRELGPLDLWDMKGKVFAVFSFKTWNFKDF
jgi:signal peptidase I